MNEMHLALCASEEWAEAVDQFIVPSTLEGVDLGARTVEFGPGPGLTTNRLATLAADLTAVELDADLAGSLAERFATNDRVRVVHADAADTGLEDASADSVVCMTMLHHVSSPAHQDAIFREAHRLLAAGGVFAGTDSRDSEDFRELHVGDVCNPVDPETLEDRLRTAGFTDVRVDADEWRVRFRAIA